MLAAPLRLRATRHVDQFVKVRVPFEDVTHVCEDAGPFDVRVVDAITEQPVALLVVENVADQLLALQDGHLHDRP